MYSFAGHVDSGSYSLSKVLAVICVAPSIPMLLLVFIIRRKVKPFFCSFYFKKIKINEKDAIFSR